MIKPAFLFTDHAVLQCGRPVPIWGACDCRTMIVNFAGNSVVATVQDGHFTATLPAMPAGTRSELRFVSESENLILRDVVVGEVWLAGGQSNMEHPTFCTLYDEGALQDNSDLRLFTVPRRTCYEGETYGFHFEEKKAEDTPGSAAPQRGLPASRPLPISLVSACGGRCRRRWALSPATGAPRGSSAGQASAIWPPLL